MSGIDLFDYMNRLVVDSIGQIAANQGCTYDSTKAADYMVKTAKERYLAIFAEMKKDGKEADLFGGLERGVVHPLVNTAASVSLKHGCVMYAKEIFEHSKIEYNGLS